MKYLLICFLFFSCNVLKTLTDGNTKVDNDFYNENSNRVHLNLSFPKAYRTYYVNDEVSVRQINIDYSGGSLECSLDGGSTWHPCNSPYTWEISNYSNEHMFRISNEESNLTESFIPEDHFPGLNFVSCDQQITSSESVASFNSRTFTANEIVCFSDGVIISNSASDGALLNDANGVVYIARDGDTVKITSAENATNIIEDSGQKIVIVGIEIYGTGTGQTGIAINQDQAVLEDIYINIPGNSSQGIQLGLSGGSATIRNSEISITDTGFGVGIYSQNSNLYIYDSIIEAGYNAIYLWKNSAGTYELYVENSELWGLKTNAPNANVGVIETYINDASNSHLINISNSTVISQGGPAFYIKGAAGIVDINLNEVKIERDNYGNVDTTAIYFESSGLTNTLVVDPNSLFCNYSTTATHRFTSIMNDQTFNVSFDPSTLYAHSNNKDISLCP